MRAVIIHLCVFAVFVQISGEHLNDDNQNNKLIKNVNDENEDETYHHCILTEIIRRIEEILTTQIKESEFEIKSVFKPIKDSTDEINSNNRKVRKSEDFVDWSKCASKLELEQHNNLENEHILAIKKELEKLKELVRLLRDQQYVLTMLTDVEKPKPKSNDEDDQKNLVELFKMLKHNLPPQVKLDDDVPIPETNNEFKKIMAEISKLQKQVENQNSNHENRLKTELSNQRKQLQALENEIEKLRSGQAIFFNLNPNRTNPDIVGAKPPNHPSPVILQRTASVRKANNKHNTKSEIEQILNNKPSTIDNPKIRAGNDDFLENLQRILLDNPDQNPETKENSFDLNLVSNGNIENRLEDLEKQLKVSQKIKQLEKKIKQIHQSNAESKIIDDEDEDLRSQLKKLQRQLNNMNKNKAETKSLDEEDILDELKNLQSAINDLRPKEDSGESKIGSADLQIMLNKLIGVPGRPAITTGIHSQLTPAQIQVLKRIMALKAGNNHNFNQQHVPGSQYGYGLDASGGSAILYNPGYPGPNAQYNALPQLSGGMYNSGPYGGFDSNKQFYGVSPGFYPIHEGSQRILPGNGPYGPNQHDLYSTPYPYSNKFGYSISPHYFNNAFGPGPSQYNVRPGRGDYAPSNNYGQHSNIQPYLFSSGINPNGGQNKLSGNYGPNPYAVGSGGYGPNSVSEYYGPTNQQNVYAGKPGNNIGPYRPTPQYRPNPGAAAFNDYDGVNIKNEPSTYSRPPATYEENTNPQINGYQNQQFFQGYKENESPNYQSDQSQPYSNPQENSYSGSSYTQQKMGELQTQIYKLKNVINSLNSPEYVQKPEDQQTIYELEHKIQNLKGIVNNLAQETNHPHYETGYNAAYSEKEGSDLNAYNEERPYSRHNRFRRDLKNSTNNSLVQDFIQQLSDIVTVINFLSENMSEAFTSNKINETNTERNNLEIEESDYSNKRVMREVNHDKLTEKLTDHHEPCTNENNCAESNKHARNKRDIEDSDDADIAMQRIWTALGALLGGTETESEDKVRNEIEKETENNKPSIQNFHNQRYSLQKQLDNLKQQLDTKLRSNNNIHLLGHRSSNPQSRSHYYQPMSYYQPVYYHQPLYPEKVYYQIDDDYDDKEKKDKIKELKLKKELKKESKSDKVFSKIVDKVIDKIIKDIPSIIRKLLGLEFDFFGDQHDEYGVQKSKNKFGIFSVIPMFIFKIFSNISYFIKKLKKNSFIKTFLVPGLVTISTAGLVVFLIWWLSGDDSHHYDSDGYGGNIGYDNGYRSSVNNNVDDDFDEKYGSMRSGSSQNYVKPPTSNNDFKNFDTYHNSHKSFGNEYPSNHYNSVSKANVRPIRYY